MPTFSNTLPMILNTTLDAVMPFYRALFARFGVTEQQWRVLRVLWIAEPVTSVELSRETLLPAPSLVGILDRLEKKNLVARVRSEDDRRKVFVVATEAGRTLQQQVMPAVARSHARIMQSVSPADWQVMETTLAKIGDETKTLSLDQILAGDTRTVTA